MASIIPNRKPDTPLNQLFTTGKYASNIQIQQFKPQSAFPGPAANIFERNKRASEDVNIKPINQNQIKPEFYNPKSYLEPFKQNSERKDIQISSLHQTSIFQRKQAQLQQKQSSQVPLSREVSLSKFQEQRSQPSHSQSVSHLPAMHSVRAGTSQSSSNVQLNEYRNYISQNENKFYQSSKVFFKPGSSGIGKYNYSTPDYFRVSQDKQVIGLNKTGVDVNSGPSKFGANGETVTVISRNNGWLTVDPETMSRKNAYEKKMKGNLHKTSHMSPSFMHTQAQRDDEMFRKFKPQTVKGQNLRCESNRLFLSDKQEPPKSIFNLGQVRHNVMTKDDSIKNYQSQRNFSSQPVRLIEWTEDQSKQKFDGRLTGKIGHA